MQAGGPEGRVIEKAKLKSQWEPPGPVPKHNWVFPSLSPHTPFTYSPRQGPRALTYFLAKLIFFNGCLTGLIWTNICVYQYEEAEKEALMWVFFC